MEHEIQRPSHHELQLLPSLASPSHGQIPLSPWPHLPATSLDLQLSISLTSASAASANNEGRNNSSNNTTTHKAEGEEEGFLKWEAAEQIRLAAMEKAYAERVRELARKEMEIAQNELARASHVWERAREEVGRAERLKARLVVPTEKDKMQITCHCCRQRFVRPSPS